MEEHMSEANGSADVAIEAASALAEEFESFSPAPYRDSGGVWTIGYGATVWNGCPVTENTPVVTEPEADADLTADMKRLERIIDRLVTVNLAPEQVGALCDFCYNVGSDAFEKSTLLLFLNQGHYRAAADQFPRWVYDDGERLAGLVRRRAAERALFVKGVAP